jgi:phosphatidylserine/phosphatidylglycerophosphate/cardiolipin synthase-like enzyme
MLRKKNSLSDCWLLFFVGIIIGISVLCLGKIGKICSDKKTPIWASKENKIEVYFSPNGGCTDAIVKRIDAAKKTILVQAYSFTSDPITKALVNAHKRNVAVQIILDKSQRKQSETYSSIDFLVHAEIPIFIDSKHAIAHNKVIIIDGEIVITGSFNFTKAAEERNAENLLVIHNEDLVNSYIKNWELHKKHSLLYVYDE